MSIFSFTGSAAVVIPVYKQSLNPFEQLSLSQCCKVLGKHPIILVKPHSLNVDAYLAYNQNLLVESFDDGYFEDIRGYNRLMLSAGFYERFLQYRFILIYQLDAFVFKDELLRWCRKGYDYIGAPWLEKPFNGTPLELKNHLNELDEAYKNNWKREDGLLPADIQFANRVGNGGFSLRRVKKFYQTCQREQQMIDYYNLNSDHHFFNEDVFWSLEVNRNGKQLKIPDHIKAVGFSMEFKPELAFELNRHRLPFGCHEWDGYLDFWRPIFKQLGFDI